MAKRKRKKKYPSARDMISPMLDVVGIGVTSSVVAGSGATGSAARVLSQLPTIQAAGALKRQVRKARFY